MTGGGERVVGLVGGGVLCSLLPVARVVMGVPWWRGTKANRLLIGGAVVGSAKSVVVEVFKFLLFSKTIQPVRDENGSILMSEDTAPTFSLGGYKRLA